MAFKIVLRGEEPSGRMLALLCARTGETIDMVRRSLASDNGLTLVEGLTSEKAEHLKASLPEDDSVEISVEREIDSWTAVLMGYRPGSRGRLRVALQKMSRLSTEEVIHFLASIPVALKTGIPRKTADKIREALEREGGIVEIRPHTGIAPQRAESRPEPVETALETGSREAAPLDEPPGREPDIPPLVSDTIAAITPVMKVDPPPEFSFQPPERDAVSAPPLAEDGHRHREENPVPHPFRFTVPARPIPRVIPLPDDFSPPAVSEGCAVVPVFLHPVSGRERERVASVLAGALDITGARARELVGKAPVAVWACTDRLNALVALRGLSEKGVPVSLIPSGEPCEYTTVPDSFAGWVNGNR
ncbi:MAG TPA: hypothetical protein PLM22_04285 [Candidatus Sabulitectum sp.]|nr:hypothetical protein [Candidatus Sabulitectum sp.]HPJ28128.1 hypothetical protein [Candidatus Sabulitectum sp.]HPR22106.1 hypothetical protein [Candidatus Sabulitectum sp.]